MPLCASQEPESKHRTRSASLGSSTDVLRRSADKLRASDDKLRTSSEAMPMRRLSATSHQNSSSTSRSPSSDRYNHMLPFPGALYKRGGGYSPLEY